MDDEADIRIDFKNLVRKVYNDGIASQTELAIALRMPPNVLQRIISKDVMPTHRTAEKHIFLLHDIINGFVDIKKLIEETKALPKPVKIPKPKNKERLADPRLYFAKQLREVTAREIAQRIELAEFLGVLPTTIAKMKRDDLKVLPSKERAELYIPLFEKLLKGKLTIKQLLADWDYPDNLMDDKDVSLIANAIEKKYNIKPTENTLFLLGYLAREYGTPYLFYALENTDIDFSLHIAVSLREYLLRISSKRAKKIDD